MMMHSKAAQTEKQDVNEASTYLGDQNAPTDENHTNSNTDILDTTVPQILVKDTIGLETVYLDPEETITKFLLYMQSRDLGTQQLIKSKGIYLKDTSSDSKWKIDFQGLIHFKDQAYIPQIEAIKGKIMKINHDNPTGGHQGMRQTTDIIHQKYYWHNI